jgi:hypothetical protein
LKPRPRDFTTGGYKIRTTETGSVPTDDDLVRTVRQGLYGTAMPGWDRILSWASYYFIPPFFTTPPEEFSRMTAARTSAAI